MYHPANYYAARTAAVNEALAEERARSAAAATIAQRVPQRVPALYGDPESLRRCGEIVSVTLGHQWGDLAGTVVEAIYCYNVVASLYTAKCEMAGKTYILLVAAYSKNEDVYDLAIRIEAVL